MAHQVRGVDSTLKIHGMEMWTRDFPAVAGWVDADPEEVHDSTMDSKMYLKEMVKEDSLQLVEMDYSVI